MPILGAHMSIAGGYDRAVGRARDAGCDCVQLFTKNNSQWRAPPITSQQAECFRSALAELAISHPLAHDSYLINLASPDRSLWEKSVGSFVVEIQRAELLGIPYVVAHPGCYISGGPRAGLRRVIRALDRVHRQTSPTGPKCLIETTAGQGTSLGWQFDQLAAILDGVKHPERLGICLDTCHAFAAGYPMAGLDQYQATMEALDRAVGLAQIKALHLNDSARDLGSRVDRHAHVGRGRMGLEPFKHLLQDPRFRQVPMYLETPKGREGGEELDVVNLRTLRRLVEV